MTLIFTLSFFSWVSLRTRRVLKKFLFVLTWTVSLTLISFFFVTVKLSDTDIYPEFSRRVLEKFIFVLSWTVSSTLIHESAYFSSSLRQIPAKSRKSVDRYHANRFQRTQPFDQICLKVRSKDVVRKLVSVNAFRSTVNTYVSDIFGPWLLLDQKHLYGARQRFCRGNRL